MSNTTNVLFSKKAIQYERAVLDALDIDNQVFFCSASIGDGFVRHIAAIKTLQLDLLRLYLSGVKKMEIPEDDKEMLKRFIARLMENFNQCLSIALAGSFRMALDTKQESMYDGIRGVSYLQERLDQLMLELAKYKASIVNDPQQFTKLGPVLAKANRVLETYPEMLGYMNCIRSATSSRYSSSGEYSEEVLQYLNNRDSAKEIVNALEGMYSEKGMDELSERLEKDVDWYKQARNFMPSDGEIEDVVENDD